MNIDDLMNRLRGEGEPSPQRDGTGANLAQLASEDNLLRAWERVRRNAGAAGVDGVAISDLEPQFPGLAQHLGASLTAGTYRPKPVLRVEIPKPSGGSRKLGIPAVIDRVVYQGMVQVLQPVFDPHFSPRSFAYRPGRGPLDAVQYLQRRLSARSGWMLRFDIQDFFDSVPHDQVLGAISRRVKDARLLALIREMLRCGVFHGGTVHPSEEGVPQGSPLSPLLANAVLDVMDQWLDFRGAIFARYADDCAVIVDTADEGERLKGELEKCLSTLSLRLNEKKTKLTLGDQAEFLGFAFRDGRNGRCERIISPGSLADYRSAVETRLNENSAASLECKIEGLTTMINSWLGYYGATEDRSQIDQVVAETEDLLRLNEWRNWGNATRRQEQLLQRNVPLELAQSASKRQDGEAVVLDALRQAFPSPLFPCLALTAVGARPNGDNKPRLLSRALDYSGRLVLQPGSPARIKDYDGLPAGWCDQDYALVRSRWIGFSIQVARYRGSLLPRIVSVSVEIRKHRIVIST